MPTIQESDVVSIKDLKAMLDPQLDELDTIIRNHKYEAYQSLNLFANQVSGNLPDFQTAFLGIIGTVASRINTLIKFSYHTNPDLRLAEEISKKSVLRIGFPLSMPILSQYMEKFKSLVKNNSKHEQLCADILTNLKVLDVELEALRNKLGITIDEKAEPKKQPAIQQATSTLNTNNNENSNVTDIDSDAHPSTSNLFSMTNKSGK